MRKRAGVVCLVVTLVAAAADKETGAKSLDKRLLDAMRAGDLNALTELFDPQALMLPPGERPQKGKEAIRFNWSRFLGANRIREARTMETGYRTSGNLSVGWGRFHLTLDPKKGGEPVNVEGRFADVAENKDGKWVYVFLMMSDLDEPLTLRHYSQ